MKFDLKKPCDNCPFRKSTHFDFPKARAQEILYARGGFACHKTSRTVTDDTTGDEVESVSAQSQMCAGRLIVLERSGYQDDWMQIGERMGFYDPKKLDMKNADVFEDDKAFLAARSYDRKKR